MSPIPPIGWAARRTFGVPSGNSPAILSRDRATIYLNDHLAGAAFGCELARRICRENEGSEFAPALQELAAEIERDRAELETLQARLEVSRDRVKATGGWIAEKAGRLKPNDGGDDYSPLSRLLEMEGLAGGVQAKLLLWRSLRELAPTDPRLEAGELDLLIARAESQLGRLTEMHARAARLALAGSGTQTSG